MQHPIGLTTEQLFNVHLFKERKINIPKEAVPKKLYKVDGSLGAFKSQIMAIFSQTYPDNPKFLGSITFTFSELDYCAEALKKFAEIIGHQSRLITTKNDRGCKAEAEKLKIEIDNLITAPYEIFKKIHIKVQKLVNKKFAELVKECVALDNLRKMQILEKLREELKRGEQNVSLRDISILRYKLRQYRKDSSLMASLLSDIDQKKIVHEYSNLMLGRPNLKEEGSGSRLTGHFFQGQVKLIEKSLKAIFEEQKDPELFRQGRAFAPKMNAALSPRPIKLTNFFYNSPYYMGPSQDQIHCSVPFNPFSSLIREDFASRMVGRCGLEKLDPQGYNGDGILFAELADKDLFLMACADAEGNDKLSQACASAVLTSVNNTVNEFFSNGEFSCLSLASTIRQNAYLEALKTTKTCSLVFNISFEKDGFHHCFGCAFGDTLAFFLTPDGTLHEFNPPRAGKLRSSSFGSLGEMVRVQFGKDVQYDAWSIKAPPGTCIILGTDGMGMHFEAETLQKSPRDVIQELQKELGQGDEEEDWTNQNSLHNEYTRHLILELCKNKHSAEEIANELMNHCMIESYKLTNNQGAIDDIAISVFKLPDLKEK